MKKPDGDTEETNGTNAASTNPRPAPMNDPKWKDEEEAESRQGYAYKGEDEVERTLRIFGDFVKRTFRDANPGERLNAWLTIVLIICSLGVAIIYLCQLREMTNATIAANQSSETAARQLELLDRPWISISFTPVSPIFFAKDNVVRVTLRANLRNVGHAVASHIVISYDQFVTTSNPWIVIPLRQKAACEKPLKTKVGVPSGDVQTTIFPGNESSDTWIQPMVYMPEILANLTDTHLTPNFHDKVFGPIYLVGCVDYQYAASPHHHQTEFAYEISRVMPNARTSGVPMAITLGKDVPVGDVQLTRWIFGGDDAN